jgi:phosphatidyl-myo-inositol dimannoside synthase
MTIGMRARGTRLLATPDVNERGGGVSVMSQLMWRVFEDRWTPDIAHVALGHAPPDGLPLHTKLAFGARVLRAQLRGARWVLFGHLGPARTQSYVPEALQRPYGVMLYGIEAWDPLPPTDTRTLARARVRIAVSSHTARRVMRANPTIGDVVACPLALAPDDTPAAPRADTRRDPIVLMVGRLNAAEAYKGHAEVIAAWPRVIARCPAARLIIVGEGDDQPRLVRLIEAAGVAAHVDFAGFVSRAELHDLYRRAAVFALPSRGEGFGLVYLEAMAHGLPCVGSTEDAAGDVIVDGVTGFLVRQDDAAALGDRLSRLLSDEGLRRTLGDAGRHRLDTEFTFSRFSSRFSGLLDRHLE